MKCKSVHYVAPEAITSPAVESQALGTALTLRSELGVQIDYYGLRPPPGKASAASAERIAERLRSQSIDLHLYPNPRGSGLLAKAAVFLRIAWSLRQGARKRPGVILTRNLIGAAIGLLVSRTVRKAAYVIDLRGHAGAELEMAGRFKAGSVGAKLFYRAERILLENASALLCVSRPLADYVRSAAAQAPPCEVIPSCLDRGLIGARPPAAPQRPRGGPEVVLAYAGTITDWNQIGPMIQFFQIALECSEETRFLMLTTNVPEAKAQFASAGLDEHSYEIRQVPHEEIISWLSKADVGLLLRESSDVNRVASPVKAAEYLASGLLLVVTEGIGDLSAIIRDEGVGLVLPSMAASSWNKEEIRRFLNAARSDPKNRERALQAARRHFDRRAYLSIYRKILDLEAEGPP